MQHALSIQCEGHWARLSKVHDVNHHNGKVSKWGTTPTQIVKISLGQWPFKSAPNMQIQSNQIPSSAYTTGGAYSRLYQWSVVRKTCLVSVMIACRSRSQQFAVTNFWQAAWPGVSMMRSPGTCTRQVLSLSSQICTPEAFNLCSAELAAWPPRTIAPCLQVEIFIHLLRLLFQGSVWQESCSKLLGDSTCFTFLHIGSSRLILGFCLSRVGMPPAHNSSGIASKCNKSGDRLQRFNNNTESDKA